MVEELQIPVDNRPGRGAGDIPSERCVKRNPFCLTQMAYLFIDFTLSQRERTANLVRDYSGRFGEIGAFQLLLVPIAQVGWAVLNCPANAGNVCENNTK